MPYVQMSGWGALWLQQVCQAAAAAAATATAGMLALALDATVESAYSKHNMLQAEKASPKHRKGRHKLASLAGQANTCHVLALIIVVSANRSLPYLVSLVDEALRELVDVVLHPTKIGVKKVTDHEDAQAGPAPLSCKLLRAFHAVAVPSPAAW